MKPMTKWRRRALMLSSAQHGRLPIGFREVEWLQGTGTQYCETGVYPINDNSNNFIGIKGNLTVLDKQNSSFSVGAAWSDRTTSNPRNMAYVCSYFYGRYSTSILEQYTARFIIQDGLLNASHVAFEFTNYVFPVDIHYELNKQNVVVNQSTYNKQTMLAYTATNQIIIGGKITISGVVDVDNNLVRVKQIDVYNVDTLLYQFVPCYRLSDNKTGFMKITVVDGSKEFFPNMGADEWIIGPVV